MNTQLNNPKILSMKKSLLLLSLFICFYLVSSAQTNIQNVKECTITAGIGFSGTTQNIKAIGLSNWLQLAYKLSENISVATEFESLTYKQPGYIGNLPVDPNDNEIRVFDNNFSLLLKYHLPIKSKMKFAMSSGWTYAVRQSTYYIYFNDTYNQSVFKNTTSFSDYRIPFLIEIDYPVSKKINIQARAKYNLNPQNGNTYSSGMGFSLKL